MYTDHTLIINELERSIKFNNWNSILSFLPKGSYLVGGLTHGVLGQQPSLAWATVIESVKPYFLITEYAFLILGFSQLVFVLNLWKVLVPNPFASSDRQANLKTAWWIIYLNENNQLKTVKLNSQDI